MLKTDDRELRIEAVESAHVPTVGSMDDNMAAPVRSALRYHEIVVNAQFAPYLRFRKTIVDEEPGFRIALEKREEVFRRLVQVRWAQPLTKSGCGVFPEEEWGFLESLHQSFSFVAGSR